MTNDQLEQLYAALPKILPNHSPDERSEAYLTVLTMDNISPMRNPLPALLMAADNARKKGYNRTRNEAPVSLEWLAMVAEDEGWEDDRVFPPVDYEDVVLREVLNSTLERLDENSAQAWILVEGRGLSPADSAAILGSDPETVATLVEGVNGLLRASLVRNL